MQAMLESGMLSHSAGIRMVGNSMMFASVGALILNVLLCVHRHPDHTDAFDFGEDI